MTDRRIGKHDVEVTHPDKRMFPDAGIRKADLVDYHERIADCLLPHVADRPLTVQRFPDGIDASGFYQQARPQHAPDWLPRLAVDHGGDTGRIEHILCDSPAALAWWANQGAITLHAWLSAEGKLRAPDQLIIDLDPPGRDFEPVRRAAQHVHTLCGELKVPAFVKTTGSRGLHVIVPLRPEDSFKAVRDAAQQLAATLAKRWPDELTTVQRKDKRDGRVYLDVLRNAFGQTAVVPWSVRALPGAPVATPLDWEELDDRQMHAQRFNMGNIFRRLGQKADPWTDIRRHAIKLDTLQQAQASMD